MATKLTTVKRQSYTVSEKLRIIQFAEQHGNRAAEREFGVSESNVRLWRKSKENLEKMPRLKRGTSWLLLCQTDLQLAVGQLVLKAAASLVADPAII